MELETKYGVAVTLYSIPIIKFGTTKFAAAADWTPAAGDVKVRKDGGAWVNIGTLPTASGESWDFVLTAAEVTAKVTQIKVVDAADDEVEDQSVRIATYGHANAKYAFDRSNATPTVNATKVGGTAVAGPGDLKADVSNLDAAVSSRATAADIPAVPTAQENATAVVNEIVEDNGAGTTWSLKAALRLILAFMVGERSGGGTAVKGFKTPGGTKTRVAMQTDEVGNSLAAHTLDAGDAQ